MVYARKQITPRQTKRNSPSTQMQVVICNIHKALILSQKDPQSAAVKARKIIADSMHIISQNITPKLGNPQAFSYALHALLLLLQQERLRSLLSQKIFDARHMDQALTMAIQLPRPDVSAYERLEEDNKHRQKNKSECNTILASMGVDIFAREKSFKASQERNEICKSVIQFVESNWETVQTQKKKWKKHTAKYNEEIVTSKYINWEKLLETVPVDESKIGQTLSQEELVKSLGLPSTNSIARIKFIITHRLDSSDKVKAFDKWFTKGKRGAPSELHAEYFDLYKFLVKNILRGEKKQTSEKITKLKVNCNKVQIAPEEETSKGDKIQIVPETPVVDMTDLIALKTLVDWMNKQSESALQQLYEDEASYQTKKQEADTIKDPAKRADLLSQQIVLNQAVLESTDKFNYWANAIDNANKLIQEHEKNIEILRQTQAKIEETKSKIADFVTTYKTK